MKYLFLLSLICMSQISHAEDGNGSERGGEDTRVPHGTLIQCRDENDFSRKVEIPCEESYCRPIDVCADHSMVWDIDSTK